MYILTSQVWFENPSNVRMWIDLIIRFGPQSSLTSPVTQVVFSACELGVFDALLSAQRPLSAEEIGRTTGASVDGTERLLAACTGLQLLNTHQQDGQGQQPQQQQQQPAVLLFPALSFFHTPLPPFTPSLPTNHLSHHLCCSPVQQHGGGQRLPDQLQPAVPLPVHPVQLQNHLPLLALPHRRRQVSGTDKEVSGLQQGFLLPGDGSFTQAESEMVKPVGCYVKNRLTYLAHWFSLQLI